MFSSTDLVVLEHVRNFSLESLKWAFQPPVRN